MIGRALLLAVALFAGVAAAQPVASPAQAAHLKAETRRIDDRFAARVAMIVGTTPAQVRRAMPDERRITATASRLVSALEIDLGHALTPEQQAAIAEADRERKAELSRLREEARP